MRNLIKPFQKNFLWIFFLILLISFEYFLSKCRTTCAMSIKIMNSTTKKSVPMFREKYRESYSAYSASGLHDPVSGKVKIFYCSSNWSRMSKLAIFIIGSLKIFALAGNFILRNGSLVLSYKLLRQPQRRLRERPSTELIIRFVVEASTVE